MTLSSTPALCCPTQVRYVNQAAVRAALNGSILILEGVEKAERNVLPLLNNLLENREMGLEDGSFLTSPKRYDSLASTLDAEQLEGSGLLRVSPDFLVIAIGVPVPKYEGNPLDPPLRSRFACRAVWPSSIESTVQALMCTTPHSPLAPPTEKSPPPFPELCTMVKKLEHQVSIRSRIKLQITNDVGDIQLLSARG
jgi:hypothetical protein